MEQKINNEQQPVKRDFNPWLVYVICLGISFLFMFFYGMNSPIHTFNPQNDYQWYMTMGHGWVAGKIPYRDLFDHKGPLTYAVFAFACLFPNPQFVIWCIEILCISLFLFFCYRIARKFLSPWLSLLVLPVMMMVLSANNVQALDGSKVEEYCFPIFAYCLLCFLDFIIDHKSTTWRRSLAVGICIGVLFWVKFTMLLFIVFPLLLWLIVNVKRNYRTIICSGLVMFGGFILVAIPILIYFAVVGALHDLFEVYFVINLTKYQCVHYTFNGGEERIYEENVWDSFVGSSFRLGNFYLVFQVLGLICFLICNWRNKSGLLLLTAVVSTWLTGVFLHSFYHYFMPLFVYSVFGIIYVLKIIIYILSRLKNKKFILSITDTISHQCFVRVVCLLFVTVLSFFIALPFVPNVKEINSPCEDYAPLVVADLLAEYNRTAETPATLFCYRTGDFGFYNAAGIVPNERFYVECSFTKDKLPEMFESFDTAIEEKRYDFVVAYTSVYEIYETFLTTYYHKYQDIDQIRGYVILFRN